MTRSRLALALLVLGVASFVTALVLVHGGGHQTVRGTTYDATDPDAPGVPTRVEVVCASAASGPLLLGDGEKAGVAERDGDEVSEDDGFTLSRQEGVDTAQVSDVCGRVRAERLTHAGELGFVGLLLVAGAVALTVGGRREDDAPVSPYPAGAGRDPETGAEL